MLMRIKEAKPRITLRANTEHVNPEVESTVTTEEPTTMLFSDQQMVSTHVQKVGEPIAFSSEFAKSTFYKPRKRQISIRIDEDVLAWFKNQPGKYQQLINQVCRAHMLANLAPPPSQVTEKE
jgi:uncharacterized protein (DUF4415 family)